MFILYLLTKSYLSVFINIGLALFALFVTRVIIVYFRVRNKKRFMPYKRTTPAKIMIVLGSGGHTHEMFSLIKNLDHRFKPRIYVLATSDTLGETKIQQYEETRRKDNPDEPDYTIERIIRCREVHQSSISSIWTIICSLYYSVFIVFRHNPEMILTNGPGTCIPIVCAGFLHHILGLGRPLLIYVESICRVKTLSLSGKLLYHFMDFFIVQWPQLKKLYPRSKFMKHII